MALVGDLIVGREFERPVVPPPSADNIPLFQHALLCQLGLPRKKAAGPLFERRSGAASLLIEGGPWHTGKDWEMQPVPYGVIPRLAFMHVCREAVRTRSALVNVKDSARAYARALGLSEGGKAMERFRRQTIALWCCRMHLGFSMPGVQGQVKVEPFEAFRVKDPDRRGLWPCEIELNQQLLGSLLEYAVALEPVAVRALQGSALSLDVYAWLAHRLCRIQEPLGVDISWAALKEQFGQEYKTIKRFRDEFVAAIGKVLPVYPQARVEVIRGGLRLLPSSSPLHGTWGRGATLPMDAPTPEIVSVPQITEQPAMLDVDDGAPATPAMTVMDIDPATRRKLEERCPRMTVTELWAASPYSIAAERNHDIDRKFRFWAMSHYQQKFRTGSSASLAEGQGRAVTHTASALDSGTADERLMRISDAALDEARAIAPDHDMRVLVEKFTAWNKGKLLHRPDKAFVGWVKSFTKDKRP